MYRNLSLDVDRYRRHSPAGNGFKFEEYFIASNGIFSNPCSRLHSGLYEQTIDSQWINRVAHRANLYQPSSYRQDNCLPILVASVRNRELRSRECASLNFQGPHIDVVLRSSTHTFTTATFTVTSFSGLFGTNGVKIVASDLPAYFSFVSSLQKETHTLSTCEHATSDIPRRLSVRLCRH